MSSPCVLYGRGGGDETRTECPNRARVACRTHSTERRGARSAVPVPLVCRAAPAATAQNARWRSTGCAPVTTSLRSGSPAPVAPSPALAGSLVEPRRVAHAHHHALGAEEPGQ